MEVISTVQRKFDVETCLAAKASPPSQADMLPGFRKGLALLTTLGHICARADGTIAKQDISVVTRFSPYRDRGCAEALTLSSSVHSVWRPPSRDCMIETSDEG